MSKIVYCDIDETLVFWNKPKCVHSIVVEGYILLPNVKQIAKLRQHSADGDEIYLWSGGGRGWAMIVARALKIEHLVDEYLSKPDVMYDDLDFVDFAPPRRHFAYEAADHANCPSEE